MRSSATRACPVATTKSVRNAINHMPEWMNAVFLFVFTGIIGYAAHRMSESAAFEHSSSALMLDLRARVAALESRPCPEGTK